MFFLRYPHIKLTMVCHLQISLLKGKEFMFFDEPK